MKKIFASAALAVALASTPASAALLLYEGFNYSLSSGDSLAGANGGTGFSGAWFQATTGNSNPTGPLTYSTSSLTSSLDTVYSPVGGSAQDTTNIAGAHLGIERTFSAIDITGNGTIWFSFLVNQTNGGNFLFSLGDGAATNNSNNGSGVRLTLNGGTGAFQAGLGSTNGTDGGGFTLSSTHFIVGRFTYSDAGNDVLDVWFNPASFTLGTAHTTASVANATFSVNSMILHSLATAITTVDEVRVGTVQLDVMAIPEPSTYALIGLGLGGLFLLRRFNNRAS